MISYLVIEPLPPVYTGRSPRGPASPEKLGKRAARLHVQDLRDTRSRKDVVTTSHALTEPKRGQQRPQIVEPDVGVSSAFICAPICLQWFTRANWRRFGGTFLFNPAAPEIRLKHLQQNLLPHTLIIVAVRRYCPDFFEMLRTSAPACGRWQAHLCPHLFAMVYEGELAAVWGHIFVQSGRAGDPAEACPTPANPGDEPGQAQFALKPS